MPDIDLGVLVHASIGIIKRPDRRAHLSGMGCVRRERAMQYRPKLAPRRAAGARFLDRKKQRRDNSEDEKTPEEALWREG
jgi:hypothetical protein